MLSISDECQLADYREIFGLITKKEALQLAIESDNMLAASTCFNTNVKMSFLRMRDGYLGYAELIEKENSLREVK